MLSFRHLVFCLTLSPSVFADTLVVDQAGGAGFDHLTISAAVAASSAGDRILIRDGDYSEPVLVTHGLVLLGIDEPRLLGGLTIEGVPYLQEVRVCGLSIRGEGGSWSSPIEAALTVNDCDGAVLLRDLAIEGWKWTRIGLVVSECRDVRARGLFVQGGIGSGFSSEFPWWWHGQGVICRDARVELVGCVMYGGWSYDEEEEGVDGAPGLWLQSSAKVSLVDSLAVGSGGTDCYGSGLSGYCDAGNGAPGVLLSDAANLWFARCDLRGGGGGAADCQSYCTDGTNANGLGILGSGASVVRSGRNRIDMHTAGPIPGANDRFRPVLLAGGSDAGSVTLTVLGAPGSACSLIYGRAPIVGTQPGISGLELVAPVRVDAVYFLDGAGRLDIDLPLPVNLLPGDRFVVQAIVDDGLQRRYSNSLPVIVR